MKSARIRPGTAEEYVLLRTQGPGAQQRATQNIVNMTTATATTARVSVPLGLYGDAEECIRVACDGNDWG